MIIIPAKVATPIITGGNSNCFLPIFFVGLVGLNRRLGICKLNLEISILESF